MPVKKTSAGAKSKSTGKRSVTKTSAKSSNTAASAPLKPKIKIQKVPGLTPVIANKDLIVNLKQVAEAPAATPSKSFYVDDEDDSLLTPQSTAEAKNVLTPEDEEDSDDDEDLSLGSLAETAVESGESSPKASVAPKSSPKSQDGATINYAAKDKAKDDKTALSALYDYGSDNVKAPAKISPLKSPHRLYQRLSLAFAGLVLLVVGMIFYFSSVKTTIVVSLRNEDLEQQLSIVLADATASSSLSGALPAMVREVAAEQSKMVPVSGTEIIGEEVAGWLTIYNKYNKPQPLVAKTRLLSSGGKLYRLRSAVNVPAGGQVRAEVYADQPSKESVVGTERFTIPGLWEGLQDKIYAESKEGDIKYGQQTKKIVTQEAIDQAIAELTKEILDKIKADADNTYSENNRRLIELVNDSVTSTLDVKVGQEIDQFALTVKLTARLASFKDADVKKFAEERIAAALPMNKQLLSIKDDSLVYEAEKWSDDGRSVEIKTSLSAEVGLAVDSEALDRQKLLNLSDEQLKVYLDGLPEVKSYNIEYSPSFIKKTPKLIDRITIKVVE